MKIHHFDGIYQERWGFSWAMLVSGRVSDIFNLHIINLLAIIKIFSEKKWCFYSNWCIAVVPDFVSRTTFSTDAERLNIQLYKMGPSYLYIYIQMEWGAPTCFFFSLEHLWSWNFGWALPTLVSLVTSGFPEHPNWWVDPMNNSQADQPTPAYLDVPRKLVNG